MPRKYSIAFISIALCFILLGTYLIFSSNRKVDIKPMEVFSQQEPITFMSSWGSYDNRAAKINQILNRIRRGEKGLVIENSSIAGAEFLYNLKMEFVSGHDPDIFGLWPGSDINMLIKEGKVADLTDLLKENPEWYDQFRPATWDTVTVDGRIYGLPIELIYEGLFINRDLFEKYHVRVPRNYEELLEAVKIFKENDIIPIAYNKTAEGSYIYQNMVMKLGGKEDVVEPFDENGRLKPCFREGMKYMKELYDEGAFPINWFSIDDKKRNELFLQKKAAMIVQGSWLIGDHGLSSMDESVDIISFPDMPNGKADPTAIIYGCGNGIFHLSNKACENEEWKEDCIYLLKELTSPKHVSILAQDAGFISNVKLGQYKPEDTVMSIKGRKLVDQSSELVGAVDWYINRNLWENLIIKQFPNVLRGKITPNSLCEVVEQRMKTMSEQEKTY